MKLMMIMMMKMKTSMWMMLISWNPPSLPPHPRSGLCRWRTPHKCIAHAEVYTDGIHRCIVHKSSTHKCIAHTNVIHRCITHKCIAHTNVQKRTSQNRIHLYNAHNSTQLNKTVQSHTETANTTHCQIVATHNHTQSLNTIKRFTSETFLFTTRSPLHSAEHHRFIHSSSLLHQYVFTAPERPRIE